MKIAVNTRLLIPEKMEGIARYIYETTRRIVNINPQHEFYFLFDRTYDEQYIFAPNVKAFVLNPQTRHPLLWYYWFEHRLPRFFKKHQIDVFYSGDMYLSLKAEVPTLLVSHDLAFHHFPEHLPWLTQKYYNYFSPLYHQKAKKIVAVSKATKQDIMDTYGLSSDKIIVAHNDAPAGFRKLSPSEKVSIQEKYSNGKPYFLYLGAIHPRKNIARLIKAFDLFKEGNSEDHVLLIAGRMAWKNNDLMRIHSKLKHKDSIIFLNNFQEDIKGLMGGAEALAYISLFEGFGIPILEAFSAGIPVITSNQSSMPEVAGDAALYVNPKDINEISRAFSTLIKDESLKNKLVENSKEQLKKFSWDNTAQLISDELNNLVS